VRVEYDTQFVDQFIDRTEKQVIKATRIALNFAARKARTLGSQRIRASKKLPATYVNDRLVITKQATDASLLAIVTGRFRPTQLIRFGAKQVYTRSKRTGKRIARGGVSVQVNTQGERKTMPGAFFIALRAGLVDGMNQGIAIRLPGHEKNTRGNPKFEVLYGPSVDQIFRDVREEIQPDVDKSFRVEFERQLKLQIGG
jgi:hypothetical protein